MSSIILQKKSDEKFEINGPLELILDTFLLIPLLNALPKKMAPLVRKSHRGANEVLDHKTTHRALEVLYNSGKHHTNNGLLNRFFRWVWFNTNNSKAVRNRLLIVKREVDRHLRVLLTQKQKIQILSIASGSARAIIDVLSTIHIPIESSVEVYFLDKNRDALDYSRQLFNSLGNPKHLAGKWINDTASNFAKYLNENQKLDVVEMVGLLDYFEDEKVIQISKEISKYLVPDGLFITANIADNSERPFVTNFIDWKMIYRNPEQIHNLISRGGFITENIKTYVEPLRIHSVVVARK